MFDKAETAPWLFDAPSRNRQDQKGELPVDDAREREHKKKSPRPKTEAATPRRTVR